MEWGLLGGERLGGTRRVRTLGMAAAVRAFNEFAVPGIGGVWFGKQVVLALLGVHLAESARRDGHGPSNIATADAVEALAVWLTFRKNGWRRDPRLPGFLKLQRQDRGEDPTFGVAGGRGFYVNQPMRIGTRDALATFGVVEAVSRRFNGYAATERGLALLDAACPNARKVLPAWVDGGGLPVRRRSVIDDLDPTRPLPDRAREILREAFVSGADPDRSRRRQALDWVEGLRSRAGGHTDWDRRPSEIADAAHWADMRAGAALSGVMDAAAGTVEGGSVLGRIEARMGAAGVAKLALAEAAGPGLRPALDVLRARALAFLGAGHDPSPGRAATRFCQECAEADAPAVVGHLTARDGRILRLVDGAILAGLAFKGHRDRAPEADAEDADRAGDEAPSDAVPPLPEGISARIRNLAALSPDLRAASAAAPGR